MLWLEDELKWFQMNVEEGYKYFWTKYRARPGVGAPIAKSGAETEFNVIDARP